MYRRNYNHYGNYNFRKTRQWVVYGKYNEEVGRFYTREEAIAYAKRNNNAVGVYREARQTPPGNRKGCLKKDLTL